MKTIEKAHEKKVDKKTIKTLDATGWYLPRVAPHVVSLGITQVKIGEVTVILSYPYSNPEGNVIAVGHQIRDALRERYEWYPRPFSR